MNSLTAQLVIDIIKQHMGLATANIWVRDFNRKIPNDDALYVVVGMVDSRLVSSESYLRQTLIVPDAPAAPYYQQSEVSRVQLQENVQIDVFSRSLAAISRHWEILSALKSIYAQQVMEANAFKIFRMPRAFLNTSDAEGGSQLNRYSITVPCFTWYQKEVVLTPDGGDYYDDFNTRVDDENSIGTEHGIIEFEITAPAVLITDNGNFLATDSEDYLGVDA